MPNLLFLTQRIPYPPIKGEKIRPLQILNHLRKDYNVHLGCLLDDPADEQHVSTIENLCSASYFARLNRRRAKLTCLAGLLTNEPLSVTFYRDRGLLHWVQRTIATTKPEVVFVCSSNMAPYVLRYLDSVHVSVCDLADVDSEKWRSYARTDTGPLRWVHSREWHRVAALETRIVQQFHWSTFVTEEEAALFRSQQSATADKVRAVPSGVDFVYFDPAIPQEPPFSTDRANFVFTGTMDYPPNIDAVRWFALDILPIIRRDLPNARFHIVGSSPAEAVRALGSGNDVVVTGRVPDVRPYVAYATACVAPLRIARGIQNKVLEAMAMARPVVVTPEALEGIGAEPGRDVLLADTPQSFAARCIDTTLPNGREFGQAARRLIEREFSWESRLRGFDTLLAASSIRNIVK